MLFLVACLATLGLAWAEPRVIEPPIRVDLQPPEEFNSRDAVAMNDVITSWITMPVDHFDPQNTDTFDMRYMYNEEFFGGPGYPVFILIGGEWNIAPGWLRGGNMFEMARENRGYQIYTEHRYYGETLPYPNFTVENLRFLNVDQALADLAYFIRDLKTQPRFAESKIVMYGGSYAANMALWFKQRYPHLAVGVVASSGPIKAEIDFTGYLEVVHEAFLLEGGEQCMSIISQGISDTVQALGTEEGRRLVEFNYRMCSPLVDYNDVYELGYFSGFISWTFSGAVQQARPGTLSEICQNFVNNAYGSTPMEQIGGFIAHRQNLGGSCWGIQYAALINTYSQNTNSRAWYYQTCTEYGYFQTAPRSGTVFDPLRWLTVDFYVDICRRAFSAQFDEEFVFAAADRVNEVYGALNPDVNNTINIHGYIDPWRALGVYDRDISETSPTYTVPRASHCFDMQNWLTTDTIRMTHAQQAARRHVARWLN
ncbi:putative serine protease K12H4.7 [Ostrinia nubilalis]|uniref:putative serine protease K12H4.7 n=1 Tax=Ostrinia nubilalis TaxID=29057 RepID=UPI0030823D72